MVTDGVAGAATSCGRWSAWARAFRVCILTGVVLLCVGQTSAVALPLPDGRAWEIVSPPEKNNALITGIDGFPGTSLGGLIQAASDGESIIYASNGAFAEPGGAPLAAQYLATRSADGWSTVSIIPAIRSESYGTVGRGGPYKAFSADLSSGLMVNGVRRPIKNPPLAEGAPEGYQNLYIHSLNTDSFQPVLTSTPNESPSEFELTFQGATPDLSHIVFSSFEALTTNAVDDGHPNLYEWSNGQLQLVSILPGEEQGVSTPVLGEDYNGEPGGVSYPMSDSGSVVFFTDENHEIEERNLYAHENGITVQVDASREGFESGGGLFQTAASDGSRVFFTDKRRLTSNSTAEPNKDLSDLYEYDLVGHRLSDLTVADPAGAEVQRVLGASEDGSYVYFVANGVLATGASRGDCSTSIVEGGSQTCNLYVWHRSTPTDTIKFIATLSEDDNSEVPKDLPENGGRADDWTSVTADRTSRVTPDGLNLVFMSDGDLTGYDNRNPETGQREEEVYDYNAGRNMLSCVSCNPSGAQPTGSSNIPGGTQYEIVRAIYQSRALSDVQGRARVFFDSSDALVPQDTNGTQDVYEWEEDGRGSCQTTDGCVGLISSGTDGSESSFMDASVDGKDVFFLTNAELVSQDTDQLLDLYDAREDGGFPALPTQSPGCEDEACKRPLAQAPSLEAPTSTSYVGSGDLLPSGSSKPAAKSKPKSGHKKRKPKIRKRKAKHVAKKAKRSVRGRL